MSKKLKPCPFCGGTKLNIVRQTEDREGWPTALRCEDCGCDGPWIYTREKICFTSTYVCAEMTGWNIRAADTIMEDMRRLWEAVQKSNDPQSPDFIPASLPMFRVADDIAVKYPEVVED